MSLFDFDTKIVLLRPLKVIDEWNYNAQGLDESWGEWTEYPLTNSYITHSKLSSTNDQVSGFIEDNTGGVLDGPNTFGYLFIRADRNNILPLPGDRILDQDTNIYWEVLEKSNPLTFPFSNRLLGYECTLKKAIERENGNG
jgi:hypothetical protein